MALSSREPQSLVVFDSCKVKTLTHGVKHCICARCPSSCVFLHLQTLDVSVTEDFLEFLMEGAVAVEVFGHKQANPRRNLALWDLGVIQAKTRSLRERYSRIYYTILLQQNNSRARFSQCSGD